MPVDTYIFVYACGQCGAILSPKPGDCCVFCSYGEHTCPPKQQRLCQASTVYEG